MRRLVERNLPLKAIGLTRVRGMSEAVNVYEVTGLGRCVHHCSGRWDEG
jgi:hypothetical protein